MTGIVFIKCPKCGAPTCQDPCSVCGAEIKSSGPIKVEEIKEIDESNEKVLINKDDKDGKDGNDGIKVVPKDSFRRG